MSKSLHAALLVSLLAVPADAQSRDPYRARRLAMVREYIEQEGITNPRVLEAMRNVPRHEFVLPSHRRVAYFDGAWPIGYKQTISPPFIVAYMTETIDPQPTDRVLEIGTGSGYQAAVLAEIVKEVYTIEIVAPLGVSAAKRLKTLGYDNVTVKVGDGYKGWSEHAPFDKIIVTCSPEKIPEPLIEQLKEGGKMIIPLGERYQQVFHLLEKKDGRLVREKLIPTLFVPMTGISEERRTVKPDPLDPKIVNGGFELDENEDGRPDGWHYQRQTTLVKVADADSATPPLTKGGPGGVRSPGDSDPPPAPPYQGGERDGGPAGSHYLRIENFEDGRAAQILQGTAIDGREIGELEVGLDARLERIAPSRQLRQKPGVYVHFYDSIRRHIDGAEIGPWLGTTGWRAVRTTVKVPPRAREMIVQIGLQGGTGRLSIDNVQLSAKKR